MTLSMDDNDGRKPVGWLPKLEVEGIEKPVVQVIDPDGEIAYTVRAANGFRPPAYKPGKHTIKIGRDKPNAATLNDVEPSAEDSNSVQKIKL